MKKTYKEYLEEEKPHCPHCGAFNINTLSDGTILCKNPYCLKISNINLGG